MLPKSSFPLAVGALERIIMDLRDLDDPVKISLKENVVRATPLRCQVFFKLDVPRCLKFNFLKKHLKSPS